jgi:cell division protein ZapA
MAARQLEVSIMGQSYMLACRPGEEAALDRAVQHVDREMCAIRDIGKIKARDRIAVLAALNIAHSLLESGEGGQATLVSAAPAPNGAANPADEWRINALLRKIDKALANDNQLL